MFKNIYHILRLFFLFSSICVQCKEGNAMTIAALRGALQGDTIQRAKTDFTDTVYTATRLRENRNSSAPYISGDTFRAHADCIFDETTDSFDPSKVTYGSIIFVKGDNYSRFFEEYHPKILCPYIMVVHNSDCSVPGRYAHMLDDEKLLAWFGQNVENFSHPKLHPIPIGIANRYWQHGDIQELNRIKNGSYPKQHLVYLNISIDPRAYQIPVMEERIQVYQQFADQSFCKMSFPKPFSEYLIDLAESKFVLSPRWQWAGLPSHMGSFIYGSHSNCAHINP